MSKKIKCIFKKKTIWGEKGGIEWLSSGFVRNFALPQEIVSIYSENKFKLIKKAEAKKKEEEIIQEKKVQEIYQQLHGKKIAFSLKKDEYNKTFGSISSKEILHELEKLGFSFHKEQLVKFSPLKEIGNHEIFLKIGSGLLAKINLTIINK